MNLAIKCLLLMTMFLSMAISAFCETADDYLHSAYARYRKGDWAGAIADCTKVIELKPDLAAGYHGRGDAEAAKGDMDGAIADYTKALELKPDDADACYSRGNAKAAKGDLENAITDYTRTIQLVPNLAKA